MKTSVKFFALMAMVFAIGACDEMGVPSSPASDNLFQIEAVPAGDFTKATDTAFEEGDALSVSVFKGTLMEYWIGNGKFTKTANGFVADKDYYWYEGTDVCTIVGFYPYASYTAESILSEGINFCVKSDQSTHAGYTASDLMVSLSNNVAPTTDKVTLTFNHLLSKVVVDVKNETSSEIANVYFDGVQAYYSYSLLGSSIEGGAGTIKAGQLATPSEGYTNSFALIIPPQVVAPTLAITTVDGKEYKRPASEAIDFGSGKVRHLTATITEESVYIEFDAIVNDWSADEDVEFKDPVDDGNDDNNGNTGEEEKKMAINPNWRVEYVGDLKDNEGNIYHNGVLVEANDEEIFLFRFFHIDYWNSTVKDNLYELVEATGNELADFINDYNQTNGTSHTIVDINGVYQGPYSTYFLLEAEAGQYVATMLGLTAEGKVSGHYAVSDVFEIVGTSEPTPYEVWLGTWKINDGNTESIITLTEDVANESYNMEGWNNVGGIPTKVRYNAENDTLIFYGQTVAENLQDIDGNVIDALYFVGFGSDGKLYANVDLAVAAWFRPEESKNVAMIGSFAYTYPDSETGEEINLTFNDVGYLLESGGKLYYATDVLHTVADGMTMIRVTEPSSAPAITSSKLIYEGLGAQCRELPTAKAEKRITGLFIAGECRFNF